MEIKFRMPTQDDVAFIASSWVRSNKLAVDQDIDHASYYHSYRELISRKLKSGLKIIVACSPEDNDFIMGFMVYDDNVIHYTYVRYSLRRQGLAKSMLNKIKSNDIEYISHKPLWWAKDYRYKKIFKFDPFLFFLEKERAELEN